MISLILNRTLQNNYPDMTEQTYSPTVIIGTVFDSLKHMFGSLFRLRLLLKFKVTVLERHLAISVDDEIH